jgi:hypothetical protein
MRCFLAMRALGRGRSFWAQRKASRLSARDLTLADREVYVARLIAVGGANMSTVDRDHDLSQLLMSGLEFWRCRGFEPGSDAVFSLASSHDLPATRKKCFREPRRFGLGNAGRLILPESIAAPACIGEEANPSAATTTHPRSPGSCTGRR